MTHQPDAGLIGGHLKMTATDFMAAFWECRKSQEVPQTKASMTFDPDAWLRRRQERQRKRRIRL